MSAEQEPTPNLGKEGQQVLDAFKGTRLILPIVIGLLAVGYLFYRQFDYERFKTISWTTAAFGWIGLSLGLLILRHFCYAFRLRTLTNGAFSWRKCLELIVLWEFSSTITPTSKGGPFIMLFVLTQEKLSAGRTAAAVFYTMLCDTSFFVLTLPFWLLLFGPPMLYPGVQNFSDVGLASGAFFVTYAMMASYWAVLVMFLVIKPSLGQKTLHWLAEKPILARFSPRLKKVGAEFEKAAAEIKNQPWTYHLKIIIGTIGAWTCKFIMINCLIIAVVPETPIDGSTQAFIYARLVAMFIIMAFSPTPGGAGLAEIALAGFISDYVPAGIGLIVALLWRGMAYYGYLIMGAIVAPAWVSSKLGKR